MPNTALASEPKAAGERPPLLSVVIPVFNEAETIAATLRALAEQVAVPHEALVVYDLDDDTTLPVVRGLMPAMPRLRLVKNTVARGPSGALRSGFAAAQAPRIAVVMADGCDDLSQVDEMACRVPAEADVVCPSRYCAGGAQLCGQTAWYKARVPRLAGRLLQALTGLGTCDPTNSYKVYSKAMLDRLRLRSVVSFSVTLEITAKAHCLGYRVVERPTVWRDRQQGRSKFQFARSLGAYLPWFGLALLRNRLFQAPRAWREEICGRAESSTVPVAAHG